MTYTLWQSSPLAKKRFKKTLEKLEVFGFVGCCLFVCFLQGGGSLQHFP